MPPEVARPDILHDIAVCIVAATFLSFLARLTRQPLILAYIIAGVLIGPSGFGFIKDKAAVEGVEQVSQLGLAFLLFIVGLEIDVKKLISSGTVAAITSILQVAGCAFLGWLIAKSLGYGGLTPLYIGAATGFSSTMIVVKLLSDQNELDTLPGRVTLGVLIMQDVFAIVVLVIQPNIDKGLSPGLLAVPMLMGACLIASTLVISRYLLPPVFRAAAYSPEVLLLTGVTWCFLVCYASVQIKFSMAMGALLAGVSLAQSPFALELIAKVRSLRDFFVTLFFVFLGMLLVKPDAQMIMGAIAVSSIVIVSRFLTVWPALRMLGLDNRTGVLSSIHLAQVSEFGLVIALLGASVELHHIDDKVVSLIVMVMVITSTLSTYLIQFSHRIAAMVMRRVAGTALEDKAAHEGRVGEHESTPIMLIGCFRIGSSLAHNLLRAGKKFTVVDFNPKILEEFKTLGVPTIYGDISNLDSLEHAGLQQAKVLISCVPDDFLRGIDNRTLLDVLRRLSPHAKVILISESIKLTRELYAAGADFVLMPRLMAAERLMEALDMVSTGDFTALREHDLAMLANRKEVVV